MKTRGIHMNGRTILALLASVVILAGAQPLPVSAAGTTANTLRVTPVRSDIEIKPGEKKTVPVTVTNVTGGTIVVSPIINDFIAGDERGTPALILDADKYAPTHSLKRFMQPLADVTIPAKQTKVIDVAIVVPVTAQAGGYFGAVRFAPSDPDGGGQVNLSASVASLILMTVPGPTVDKLNLTEFKTRQNSRTNWFYTEPQNILATVRLENKGNAQSGPFGRIAVRKGDKVVMDEVFNGNTPRDMVLPDSARRWDVPLKGIDGFGKYTVSGTFTYGQKNQTIEVEETFWIIPVAVMIAAGVGLVALIGLIAVLSVVLKGRKKRMSMSNARDFRRR